MEIGASIFFTDYSMAPTELAVAIEERGFDSLWVAEHSHIPSPTASDCRAGWNCRSSTTMSWIRSSP